MSAPNPSATLAPPEARTPSADLTLLGDGRALLELSGRWRIDTKPPTSLSLTEKLVQYPELSQLQLTAEQLDDWDSLLVVVLLALLKACRARHIACDLSGLPQSLHDLLKLAQAAEPAGSASRSEPDPQSFIGRLGEDFIALAKATGEIMRFFGEGTLTVQRFLRGQAKFRRSEFWLIVEAAGADALPIVGLVCFLVGMILAYIGNQQLAQFGARIYIADLVGLAMVIQIAALVTAIVLAGRTGAAFAAQLGAMQANEEIDALKTLGLSPMEFLVLPRMLALILMTPLLALYANFFGILGGAFVGTTVAGLTLSEYLIATQAAIAVNHVAQGLISATVYGAIVAASGCLRGMQCGRSAADVGRATTSAVVTAILFIVIAAAVLTVLFQAIGLS